MDHILGLYNQLLGVDYREIGTILWAKMEASLGLHFHVTSRF